MALRDRHLSQESQFQILIKAQFFLLCTSSIHFGFSRRSMQVQELHPRQFLHATEIGLAKPKFLIDGSILTCAAYLKVLQNGLDIRLSSSKFECSSCSI